MTEENPPTIKSLEIIKAKASGLNDFDKKKFEGDFKEAINADHLKKEERKSLDKLILPYLSLFIHEKFSELKQIFTEDPSLIASNETKSLHILNLLMLGQELSSKDIFPFKQISAVPFMVRDNLAKALIEMYEKLFIHLDSFHNNENFLAIDFIKLAEIIPELIIYYSDFILKNKIEDKYTSVFNALSQIKDLNLVVQKYRLLAFYYRRKKDFSKAEEMMLEYRKLFKVSEKAAEIQSLANEKFFKAEDVLSNWKEVLGECSELQNEVLARTGIHEDTCGYYGCDDCCNYTFPVMSLTEHLYLKQWMRENNYPLDKAKEKAKRIQNEYQELHGEKLQILDKSKIENNIKGIENPYNFKYSCPFLEKGRCSIYEARPILCRGFGLATDNNISVKTCNYYLNQYKNNSSNRNERVVYDMQTAQSLAKSSDKKLSSQELSGTIVAWLSEDPEY